jgi:hypothetical protein
MKNHQHYRIVTPDGRLSRDTFIIADQQPVTLEEDCLLMIDESDGREVAVHDTRLFPPEAVGHSPFDDPAGCVCKECGKVDGLEGEQEECPYGSDARCGLVEPLEEEAEGLLGALRFEIVEARHYRATGQQQPAPPAMLTSEKYCEPQR